MMILTSLCDLFSIVVLCCIMSMVFHKFKLYDVLEAGSAFINRCKRGKNPAQLGPLDKAL
jgi:hypothetical protein